jgi:hypothetical protein
MAGAGARLGLAQARPGKHAVTDFSLIAMGLAALFCLARAVVDVTQRRYAWAVASLLCGALLLSVPIGSHAVKYDLPQTVGR